MHSPRILVALALVTLTGCGSSVSIDTDYNRSADFSKYKTYAWHPQGMTSTGIPVQRANAAQWHIKTAVDAELAKRNIKIATYGTPDFYVACTIGAVNTSSSRNWARGEIAGQPVQVPLDDVQTREGSLVLDFVDNKTNVLFWRGIAQGAVRTDTPADVDVRDRMFDIVQDLLAHYPPK